MFQLRYGNYHCSTLVKERLDQQLETSETPAKQWVFATMRVLLIDNYDSFTFNLLHLIGGMGPQVEVVRNDVLTVSQIISRQPDLIVLSPGPCTPNEAGVCLDLIKAAAGQIPIFGVCLGLQAIGQAFGGHVIRAPQPMHGKVSEVEHQGKGLFRGINGPVRAARYHSLVIDRTTLPITQYRGANIRWLDHGGVTS
jgi:anthranilate synthase component II